MTSSGPVSASGAGAPRGVAGSRASRGSLDPAVIARLAHLDVRARLVVEGFIAGMHRSPFHGFSVEFAEHRPYMPGDPLKNLDWKVWARSDRYLVKQYTEETNLRCHLLLDLSGSMAFRSTRASMSKLDYARSLSAALAYLMLQQQDAVGAMLFADRPLAYVPPRSVRSHLDAVLRTFESARPQGTTRLGPVLHELAERIKRRGLVVLCSDLMDRPADVLQGLQHFRHRHHEVVVFHVLDPDEIEFPYTDTATFVDMESRERLTTEPWEIAKRYRERFRAWSDRYLRSCREQRIDYVRIDTRTPFDQALLAYLEKRAKLL
ncbi:MAG: DUF58 domain-containing protein [Candidatus Eisenbacteria bacterium]|nr:DUF58 domain-containing protein [Candidatus Eisenbacteria bacterium]